MSYDVRFNYAAAAAKVWRIKSEANPIETDTAKLARVWAYLWTQFKLNSEKMYGATTVVTKW